MALGLTGRIAEEWNRYTLALNQGNVFISEDSDKIVWVYNSKEGHVTTKLTYCSTILEHSKFEDEW